LLILFFLMKGRSRAILRWLHFLYILALSEVLHQHDTCGYSRGDAPLARLTQRRYFDDSEVKDRGGIVPPLGPARLDGPLTAPTFPQVTRAVRPADGQDGQQEHEPTWHHADVSPVSSTAHVAHPISADAAPTPHSVLLEQ
jgi:hypothetical protein